MRKYKNIIIALLIVITCFLYLSTKTTYTAYESETETSVEGEVADWKIKVNNTLVTSNTAQQITIDTIDWDENHTKEGTISPGTSGIITISIDPTTTQVAFDYYLEIIDQTVDENKLLTITKVESSSNITKEENTYHGTMTLQDIKDKKKEQIKLYATWDDHGEDVMVNPNEDPQPSDLLEVNFKAAQKKK